MSGITIVANGKPRACDAGASIADLLRTLDLSPALVLVEFNGAPLERERYDSVTLRDGDRLEIAQMVGGG